MGAPVAVQAVPITKLLTGEPPQVEWIIPNFIPKNTVVCIAGDSNIGKSFLGYSWAMRLALGLTILREKTLPQKVLYLDQENSEIDLRRYLHQLYEGLGRPDRSLLEQNLFVGHHCLGYKGWRDAVMTMCQQVGPNLIVFDTATSVFGLEDDEENQNAVAANIIGQLRSLPAGSLIWRHVRLFMDKYGKEHPIRSMRGAKIWRALVDQVAYVVSRGGRPGEALRKGWKPTRLEPDKTRSCGLSASWDIVPKFVNDEPGRPMNETPCFIVEEPAIE